MAKRRIDPEEWRRMTEESAAWRQRVMERIAYHERKLAEEKSAQAEWEARRAHRAERIHRILTLGLGRAA